MIYVLWALLNIAAAILFIALCYKATVLIKQRYGAILAFVFAVGLIVTCINTNMLSGNKALAAERTQWKFESEKTYEGAAQRFVKVKIADNLLFRTSFYLQYAITESGSQLPLSGYTSAEGFFSGVKWQCAFINVQQEGSKIHYEIHGTLSWSLMNMHINEQSKKYKGTIDLATHPVGEFSANMAEH